MHRSCPICSARSPQMKRSPASRQMAPMIPASAAMPSRIAAHTLSSRNGRRPGRGRPSPPVPPRETKSCGLPNTLAGPRGDDGADTTARAAPTSKPMCNACSNSRPCVPNSLMRDALGQQRRGTAQFISSLRARKASSHCHPHRIRALLFRPFHSRRLPFLFKKRDQWRGIKPRDIHLRSERAAGVFISRKRPDIEAGRFSGRDAECPDDCGFR